MTRRQWGLGRGASAQWPAPGTLCAPIWWSVVVTDLITLDHLIDTLQKGMIYLCLSGIGPPCVVVHGHIDGKHEMDVEDSDGQRCEHEDGGGTVVAVGRAIEDMDGEEGGEHGESEDHGKEGPA